MTKPLPQRDVEARPIRSGRARLTRVEQRALASVEDENLKKVIAELLISSRNSQQNFQEIEQWFPVQPADISQLALAFRFTYHRGFALDTATPGNLVFDKDPPSLLEATRMQLTFADIEGHNGGAIIEYIANTLSTSESKHHGLLVIQGERSKAFIAVNLGAQIGTFISGEYPGFEMEIDPITSGEDVERFVDGERVVVTILGAPEGKAGPKGEKGATGEKGEKGTTGEKGEKGATGEKGEKGTTGEKGEKGATGTEGRWASLRYAYLTNTEETEPAAGRLKFNAGKTSLRISETDGDGGGIGAYLAAWDDSTTTGTRGFIIFRKIGTPAIFAVYKVTGALVDKGTWDTLPVELVSSNGAFSNEDAISVEFYRVGDQGEKGATGAPGPRVFEESETGEGVEWKEGATLREIVLGFRTGTTHVLRLFAESGGARAALDIVRGATSALTYLKVNVGGLERTLLDGSGKSHYLQISPLAKITDYGLVEALPGSPEKGDRCMYIAEKANGIVWDLVYEGEGEFPWKKVGGPPLTNEVATAETTKSAAYVDLATGGPTVTVPLKGDYLVGLGCAGYVSEGSKDVSMSYSIGATAAVDVDRLKLTSTGVFLPQTTQFRRKLKKGLVAAAALKSKYKTTGGEATFENRFIEVDPVRVG